jgi:hypothetical protein
MFSRAGLPPQHGSLLRFGLEAIRRNRTQLFNSCSVLFWPVVSAVIGQLIGLACALVVLGYELFFADPTSADRFASYSIAIYMLFFISALFLSFVYRMARVSSACEQCVTSLMLRGAYRFSDPVDRQRLNWLVNETLATRDADFFTVSGSRVSMTAWLQVASLLGTVIAAALTRTFGFK